LLTLYRFIIPNTQVLVQRVTEVELDLDMAIDGEETKTLQEAKQTKIWRTLRTAARTKLNMFDKVDDGNNLDCLIDKGAEPITEGDDAHDVADADDEGIRPADDNDHGSGENLQAPSRTNPD
jgi:THO complex subunit 1